MLIWFLFYSLVIFIKKCKNILSTTKYLEWQLQGRFLPAALHPNSIRDIFLYYNQGRWLPLTFSEQDVAKHSVMQRTATHDKATQNVNGIEFDMPDLRLFQLSKSITKKVRNEYRNLLRLAKEIKRLPLLRFHFSFSRVTLKFTWGFFEVYVSSYYTFKYSFFPAICLQIT